MCLFLNVVSVFYDFRAYYYFYILKSPRMFWICYWQPDPDDLRWLCRLTRSTIKYLLHLQWRKMGNIKSYHDQPSPRHRHYDVTISVPYT